MDYKPTNEQIAQAKLIYDEIIFKMVLNKEKIMEAFRLLNGYDAMNQQQARKLVAIYFTYNYVAPVNEVKEEVKSPNVKEETLKKVVEDLDDLFSDEKPKVNNNFKSNKKQNKK